MARLPALYARQQEPEPTDTEPAPGESPAVREARAMAMANYMNRSPQAHPAAHDGTPPTPLALIHPDTTPPGFRGPVNGDPSVDRSQLALIHPDTTPPGFRGPVNGDPSVDRSQLALIHPDTTPEGFRRAGTPASGPGAPDAQPTPPAPDPAAPKAPGSPWLTFLQTLPKVAASLAAAATSPRGYYSTANPQAQTVARMNEGINQDWANDTARRDKYASDVRALAERRKVASEKQAELGVQHGFKNRELDLQKANAEAVQGLRHDMLTMKGDQFNTRQDNTDRRLETKETNAEKQIRLRAELAAKNKKRPGSSAAGAGTPGPDPEEGLKAMFPGGVPESVKARLALAKSLTNPTKRAAALSSVVKDAQGLIPQTNARADAQLDSNYQKEYKDLDQAKKSVSDLEPLIAKYKDRPDDMPGVGVVASRTPQWVYGMADKLGGLPGLSQSEAMDATHYRQAQTALRGAWNRAMSGKVLNATEMKMYGVVTGSEDITPRQFMEIHKVIKDTLDRQQSTLDASYPAQAAKVKEARQKQQATGQAGSGPLNGENVTQSGGIGGLPPPQQKTGGGAILGGRVQMKHGQTGEAIPVKPDEVEALKAAGWELAQ